MNRAKAGFSQRCCVARRFIGGRGLAVTQLATMNQAAPFHIKRIETLCVLRVLAVKNAILDNVY